MPYNTSDAIPRSDISTVLMEAVGQKNLYIGQMVLPVYDSPTEVGRYPKFTTADTELLKAGKGYAGSTKRGATGTYNESESKHIWDAYQTQEYGEERRVDDVVAGRMANFFDAEMVEAEILMHRLMLDYEMEVSATINDPAVFTATNPTVAYTEANIANGTLDFPKDLQDCIERLTLLGEIPTHALMSLSVFNRIRRSAKLNTYLFGPLNTNAGGSLLTEDAIAAAFGLQGIIVAKKSVDTAMKGMAPSLTPVWGNSYIAVGQFGVGGDFMAGGCGRTIVWANDSPGGLFTSESYRDEKRRGNMLRVRSNRVQKIINARSTQLITLNFS